MKKVCIMKLLFMPAFLLVLITPTKAQSIYGGKLGYGVSPEGHPYDFSKFGDFLQEVADMCDEGVVYANSAWRDAYATSGQIPNLQKIISLLQPSPYDYVDMVTFCWRSRDTLLLRIPGGDTNNWSNAAAKTLFLQMLISAADSLQPTYLFIGNEISTYWLVDSTDYLNWISFYHEAYDSVKAYSPNTKVGTIFNYEHLAGVGFLTGWDTPYWSSLEALDTSKIDILGLTVYPFFNYKAANEVPDNYLDPIFNRMGTKAIAITETGWPADSFIGSWKSSPIQQVDYVNKLFDVIDGHNVEVVNWLFLNYLMDADNIDPNKIFCSVAMRDSLGNDRPALSVWLSKCDTTTEGVNEIIDHNYVRVTVYPNPFYVETVMRIDTFDEINAELGIYDLLGRQVRELNSIKAKEMTITRENLPGGIYFYTLKHAKVMLATGKIVIY